MKDDAARAAGAPESGARLEEAGERTAGEDRGLLGAIARETSSRRRGTEVILGRVVGLHSDGRALVEFPENPAREPAPARSSVVLEERDVGREAALLFEGGDLAKPIVMGLIRTAAEDAEREAPRPAELDGEKLVLTAEREIVLRCGEASLTLTRAGKILLRGKYLLSRSSGVNRIKGGSVQLN